MRDPDTARRAVKAGVDAGMELLRTVDEVVRQKIGSLSRTVQPGTREWDELYEQYLAAEHRRRGL